MVDSVGFLHGRVVQSGVRENYSRAHDGHRPADGGQMVIIACDLQKNTAEALHILVGNFLVFPAKPLRGEYRSKNEHARPHWLPLGHEMTVEYVDGVGYHLAAAIARRQQTLIFLAVVLEASIKPGG